MTRDEDAEAARRVRRIVPGSGEGRIEGVEGAGVPAVKAVPVRPEALKARASSSVVRPLTEVEQAPIMASQTPVGSAAVTEAAPLMSDIAPSAKARPKPKPAAKPKAATKAEAGAEKVAMKAKAEPKPKAAKPKAEKAAKPAGLVRLKAPRKGQADDLKEIEGIGPALEKLVNGMGFFHFDQIAAWTEADVALVDAEMKTFKGRITRDKWVEQARIIVTEGLEAFRERAQTNEY
jgi:NADH-quinone oxidoreductase subunit E